MSFVNPTPDSELDADRAARRKAELPTSKERVYEDGELWSFIRRCMSQGKDIHLDHAQRTYEEYSARLDVAALERLPELQAYIVRAVVAARAESETNSYEELRKRATRLIVAMRRDRWEGYDHGYANDLAELLNVGRSELKAGEQP